MPVSPTRRLFDREFLLLAATWLACRRRQLEAADQKDRVFAFIGEMDYGAEMAIAAAAERARLMAP